MINYKQFNKGYCKITGKNIDDGVILFPDILIYPECEPLVIAKNIIKLDDGSISNSIETQETQEKNISNNEEELTSRNNEILMLTHKADILENENSELNENNELLSKYEELNKKFEESVDYIKKIQPYLEKAQTKQRTRKNTNTQTQE